MAFHGEHRLSYTIVTPLCIIVTFVLRVDVLVFSDFIVVLCLIPFSALCYRKTARISFVYVDVIDAANHNVRWS